MKALIFLILFTPLFTLSQTKKETEDWILGKVREYYNDNVFMNTKYFFKDNCLFSESYILNEKKTVYNKMPISTILEIEIDKNRTGRYTIKLSCEDDAFSAEYGSVINGKYFPDGRRSIFYIFLDTNFSENNMVERMGKALVHLVSLYGGEAKIKKEPF